MLSAPPSALNSDALDLAEVHRDVRDVAEKDRALAVRRDGDLLGDVGAVEGSVSKPSWPSTVSLPSPGFHSKVRRPRRAAPGRRRCRRRRSRRRRRLVRCPRPGCPGRVVAVAGVDHERQHIGRQARGRDGVVALAAVDPSTSCASVLSSRTSAGSPTIASGGSGANHSITSSPPCLGPGRCRPRRRWWPEVPAKSMLTSVTSVPLRSRTRTVSGCQAR